MWSRTPTPTSSPVVESILTAVVQVVAAWRATQLVTRDEITRPLRERVQSSRPGSRWEYLVDCPVCVSVWVGGLVASGVVPRPVIGALALSAGVIWINESRELLERVGDG